VRKKKRENERVLAPTQKGQGGDHVERVTDCQVLCSLDLKIPNLRPHSALLSLSPYFRRSRLDL